MILASLFTYDTVLKQSLVRFTIQRAPTHQHEFAVYSTVTNVEEFLELNDESRRRHISSSPDIDEELGQVAYPQVVAHPTLRSPHCLDTLSAKDQSQIRKNFDNLQRSAQFTLQRHPERSGHYKVFSCARKYLP